MLTKIYAQKQTPTIFKLIFWLVLFLLIYLTLTPIAPQPIELDNIDKFYHFVAFAGFSFFFIHAYRQFKNLTVILLSIGLGILIEIIQHFIPNRGFSYADMLADAIGVLFGLWVARKIIASFS